MPTIIRDWDDTTSPLLAAFDDLATVAVDIEGVDLGRDGCISLIQVATPDQCFLFDVLDKDPSDSVVIWLKFLLEDNEITKIIHDCRMDSDALLHTLDITLTNVHDTSCFHHVIDGVEDASLNTILKRNKLPVNVTRDGSVYTKNHEFWKQRPLTPQMIEWAVGDIASLLNVYDIQTRHNANVDVCPTCTYRQTQGQLLSNHFLTFARGARTAYIQVRNRQRFLGYGGWNVKRIKKSTNTLLYHRGDRSQNNWMVYYTLDNQLCRVTTQESSHR